MINKNKVSGSNLKEKRNCEKIIKKKLTFELLISGSTTLHYNNEILYMKICLQANKFFHNASKLCV